MGIGFDVFKANIGWNLADSVMGSISNAVEKNAAEQEAKAQAAKMEQDKNDMLKTLIFMVGNNMSLDRNGKKSIAAVLSTIYDENISLFSIEEKIDSAYAEIKTESPKQFFSTIAAINSDREQVCAMYLVTMFLYMELSDESIALPAHAYNLSLIKRFFAISRTELAKCYAALGEKLGKDIDDIADIFEELTSEESMKKIEAENPTLVYEETEKYLPSSNPKGDIETIYHTSIHEVNGDEEFKKRFFLADSNPKKIFAAVNAYAKNCKGEEIIAMYDDSSFLNGKVGFLLSNKKLYICNSFQNPQEIELSSVNVISAPPKSLNPFIKVNDIQINTSMLNKKKTEVICNFLQKAIPIAMQIEVK
jgi:hypothetical protein